MDFILNGLHFLFWLIILETWDTYLGEKENWNVPNAKYIVLSASMQPKKS